MKQVFISYPSQSKSIAYDIMNHLEKNNISCFIAPRDIDGGENYASALVRALGICDVVLLVASSHINDSDHVLNEINIIFNKKKPILPVFVEDFELRDEYKYYLGTKHWVTAYPDPLPCYFTEIYDAVVNVLPKDKRRGFVVETETKEDDVASPRTTVFEYIPERGIMKNPADHQRNVSFRTDTFVNMMGGIFEKVRDLTSEADAESIFYQSGYSSGRNFAERINTQWDTDFNVEGIKAKFEKWCQFDSAVGWGKFSSTVDFDEENDTIKGTICISEAFIVDNTKKRKICAFIRGYCTGVVEIFLDTSDVELVCRSCPMKSRLGTKCIFDFELK